MRKLLVVIFSVALFAACTQQNGFKITVKLDGADGKVVLEQRGASQWIGIDTADVVDGVAVLEGEVEFPGLYYLSVNGQRNKAIIFVENANIAVTGKADSIAGVAISGSSTHDEFKKINDEIQKIGEEYMGLYQEARTASAAGDTTKAQELMKQVEELYASVGTLQEDFVKNNPASYVTPMLLTQIQYEKDEAELEALVNALDPKLSTVPEIVTLKEKIEKLKKVSVGQNAPDFTQNDADGNPVKFSDIYSKNELTLIDFWASWCGPCRAENPNVVATYNKYKDQGFSVFGVSLDRDKDAWLKAIEDDGLTWEHVSDLAYWNNAAAKMYAVSSIPSSLLVDKNGKIVAKNKRGEELGATVAEFLAQ
ncbi:TlpA disulfide reductase family protein [Draconibacterium sp. IB214405]|uniref:TlpA disulfide reductase family protein n=1 Tax=Draconibacterium sp. IB214405 TaxID=3097352 RepID=UPI002A1454F0|nr:TlpA disulfide reductase family protein [Draconibacterium sp. IB214405]MDX8338739.1 TlpA disulfide reductase family protein [Draconibacterium sp. IB214405]